MNCEEGITMSLRMTTDNFSNVDKDEIIIDNLQLKCEYFAHYDDVHFTIPNDAQSTIFEAFKTTSGFKFALKLN